MKLEEVERVFVDNGLDDFKYVAKETEMETVDLSSVDESVDAYDTI